jgi:hypothetical protein
LPGNPPARMETSALKGRYSGGAGHARKARISRGGAETRRGREILHKEDRRAGGIDRNS